MSIEMKRMLKTNLKALNRRPSGPWGRAAYPSRNGSAYAFEKTARFAGLP
jgi:hypothetical protein